MIEMAGRKRVAWLPADGRSALIPLLEGWILAGHGQEDVEGDDLEVFPQAVGDAFYAGDVAVFADVDEQKIRAGGVHRGQLGEVGGGGGLGFAGGEVVVVGEEGARAAERQSKGVRPCGVWSVGEGAKPKGSGHVVCTP